MKEIFLAYAKTGAMTKEQLADVLKVSPETIRRMAKAGKMPRVPGVWELRFDPMQMIDVFCTPKVDPTSSLTIERHKTGAKPGGFRKCL